MKILIKSLLLISISIMLNSCSLFLGGIIALDNSANKGEKEVKYEKIVKLNKGKRIILELTDSTKIKGTYKGHNEFNKGNKQVNMITVIDENDKLKSINTSDISKYIYVDEGGNVWTAVAIGGVIDAFVIYGILKGPKIGLGGARIF